MSYQEFIKMLESGGGIDASIIIEGEKGSCYFGWTRDKKDLRPYIEVLESIVNKQVEQYRKNGKILLVWK